MQNSSRDLLFLSATLVVAGCLMLGGAAIYPDNREMEFGLARSQAVSGAPVSPPANLFAIGAGRPFDAKVDGTKHAVAENGTDENQPLPVGGRFGRGFPQFQVDLRTVLADLGHPHSVTQIAPRRPQ